MVDKHVIVVIPLTPEYINPDRRQYMQQTQRFNITGVQVGVKLELTKDDLHNYDKYILRDLGQHTYELEPYFTMKGWQKFTQEVQKYFEDVEPTSQEWDETDTSDFPETY